MPGKILNIKVSAGQAVKFGETVIVMEAMKMETEIVAPADGTVAQILVKAGDAVDTRCSTGYPELIERYRDNYSKGRKEL